MKKRSLYVQSVFYIAAGINHFVNPDFYAPLIPPYLPFHEAINFGSGLAEVLLGLGLFIPRFRTFSAIGIIVLLVLFIPAHIFHIQVDGCLEGGPCIPVWVAWVRLLIIHPLLMAWAWWNRNDFAKV
jgi:uncharacterized membrane protein